MSVRRATALTLSFALIDSTDRPSRRSGVSFGAGSVQVARDGGSFVDSTNTPVELGSTGRYALTLTAAEMDAAWVHLKVSAPGSDELDLTIGTSGHPSGTVLADGANSATSFRTSRTEAATNHWRDALLVFTSGALAGQVKKVSAFDASTDFVTVSSAYTGAPTAGDRFLLVEL